MADTLRTVTCPACDKEMTKIFMEDVGVNVDLCLDGCGGILFNNRELEKFDEQHENADKLFQAYKNKDFEPVDEKEVRICSICNTPMVKQGSGVDGVKIDVCNVCGAKFLDHGELEKIRKLNGKNTEHQEKINSLVDAVVNENPIITGGKIGAFAQKHIKITPAREKIEGFINFILENK